MNHIYKVVFNKATGAFVAVAEFAKGQGKKSNKVVNSSQRTKVSRLTARTFVLSSLAIAMLGINGTAMAAVVDGKQTSNTNKERNITIATDSQSNGNNTINAEWVKKSPETKIENGEDSIALGSKANIWNAKQSNSKKVSGNVAIGRATQIIGKEIKNKNDLKKLDEGFESNDFNSLTDKKVSESIAIGSLTRVFGDQSTAMGNNVLITGDSSVAIGGDDIDKAKDKKIETEGNKTVGQLLKDYTGLEVGTGKERYRPTLAEGAASVVLGVQAQAKGDLGTAVGTRATASKLGASAFGVGADASKVNSVALGAGSKTDTDATKELGGTISLSDGSTLTFIKEFAGGQQIQAGDQVSIGSKGYERQIKHVAPGKVNTDSTDAINGSQLYLIASEVGKGFTAKANTDDGQVIKPGDTIDFVGTDGVEIQRDGSKFTFKSTVKSNDIKTTELTTSDEGKVKAPENDKKDNLVTAKNIAETINNTGFNVKTGSESGKELVKNGDTVAFEAGNNLTVERQGKTFTYATKNDVKFDNVQSSSTVKVGGASNPILIDGSTHTIKGLSSNLNNVPSKGQKGVEPDKFDTSTAATVGDVLNAGFNLQQKVGNENVQKDFVKGYDNVVFADGNGTKVDVKVSEDNKTSTIKYDVEVDNDTIKVIGGKLKATSQVPETTNLSIDDSGKVTVPTNEADKSKLVTAENIANTINESGFTVKANNEETGEVVNPGDTVDFINGKNIKLTRNGTNITVATTDDVEFNKVTAKNIKAGDVNATNMTVENVGNDVNSVTNKKYVDDGRTEVVKGTNVESVTATKDEAGKTTYTVNAEGAKVTTESGSGLKVDTVKASENVTDYKISLADATKGRLDKADSALQTVVTQIDGKKVKTIDKKDNTANFVTGTNISLKDDGKGGIKVSTADDVTFKNVTSDTMTVKNSDSLGQPNGTKNYVTEGNTSVVNGGDVYHAINTTEQQYKGDNGEIITRNPKEVLEIVGGATTGTEGNIRTVANPEKGTLELQLAKDIDLTDAGSITVGDTLVDNSGITIKPANNTGDKKPVKLTNTGLDNGGNTITNVAPGEKGTDAVNVDQLTETKMTIAKGFNITADQSELADDKKVDNIKLGETVKYTSTDKNIVTTVSDNTIDFGLNSELTVGNDKNPGTIVVKGKDGKDGVTINGKDGTIGLNGKDGANGTISVKNGVPGVDGKGVNGKDGITRVVVDDIEVATMKDGLKFAGNTGNTIAKKLNETLTVKGELDKDKNASGANLRVDSKDGNLNLVIAKDLTDIDSITVNNGGPVINKDGIDMNNKPITNVKSGLDNYTADNAPTPKANGLLNLSNSTNSVLDSNAATVGDLRNMGWVVSASGNEYSEQVKNANEVDFVGSGLATVTGKTEGNKRVITVDVNPQEVTNIAQLPVVYTTEDGDRVVKDPNSNNFYLAKNDGQPDYSKAPIEPENVIASMNDGLNSTKSPLFLSNVASNLPGTDAYKSIGNDFTNNIDVPDNVNKIKHNAATVDDVLNVGFNLQGNGKAVDFVKAYDTVNFVDGAGTKASVITTDNLTNKIAYNVNADNETVVVKGVDDKGNTVYQQKDGSFNTEVGGTGSKVDLAKVKYTQVAANTGNIIAETKNNIATGKTTFNEADKNKVATVGDVSNAINNSGFTVKANGDSGQMVNPGSAVDFISGDNIKVTRDGTNIKVATEDKVKFKDVVADTMTVKNKNSVANGGDTNYVTEGSTSVVNGGDVYHAINTTDQQYTGDNGDVIVKRNPSQVLAIKGGAKTSTENNIKTVANEDGSIAIKLAETIDLGKKGSVKLGDTLVDNSGLTISSGANGPVKLTNEGLDNGNNVIANVAPGVEGTDAVNVDQLNKAAAASKTTVKAGKNTTVTGTPDEKTGAMTYVVDADSASVSSGSDAVTVAKGNRDDKGNTNYKVDLSANTKNSLAKADTALQEVVTQIDGQAVKTIDKDNNTANFVTGTNIKLKDDGQGGIKVSTADDVTFENVTSDTMTVKKVGNSLNSVTNKQYVDDGRTQVKSSNGTVSVNKTDSGNGSIYDLSVDSQGVTNNSQLPVVYTDAKGNKVYKQPDGAFNTMINGQGDVVDTGDIITSINSADGSTTKPTKLTNVADGTISANSKDAINGSQLYDTNTQVKGNKDNIAKGFNISADNGADDNVQLGDTVNYTSDDKNIVTTVRDNEIDFGLADKITVGDKGEGNPIDIDGNKGTIGGLTNKTFNSNNFVSGQAATEDQLAEVAKQAGQANKGWKLSVNGQKTNATDVKPTNVVDFSAADKNIVVSKDNNDIKVGLANDIEVDSLKAGDTTVNNNGIAIKAPANDQGRTDVSLTANGLNNGGNRITRVAPGVDGTDAVNVNQLKSLGYNLNNKIDKVGDEANAGVSSAMAMASLPQAYLPGKSMITGGMATYNGQGAVAVGLSKLSDNGKWVFKISGSADTEGNAGGAVGAGFHF